MSEQVRKLLKVRAVCELTGLPRSSLYQFEREGKFPQRVAIGPRAVAWHSDEIWGWIESRPRKAGAQ